MSMKVTGKPLVEGVVRGKSTAESGVSHRKADLLNSAVS